MPAAERHTLAAERDDVVDYYREIAPFYDAELGDRDDLELWTAVASRQRGGRFLELGAGSGRVTEVLAPFARDLVAVDLSPDMLRLARGRLAGRPNVQLVLADMLELPFTTSSHTLFDLIAAADDPFSHLTERAARDRALQVVARHLAPHGRFVLDALWLAPDDASAVSSAQGRVREHTSVLDGQALHVVERWRRIREREQSSAQGHSCRVRYEYVQAGRAPVVAQFEAHDWSPAELLDALRRAGLRVDECWGSYRGEAWQAGTSKQLIVSAGHA